MDEALGAPGQPDNASRTRTGGGRYADEPDTALRDAQATELRRNGKSYRQIATELGISPTTAHEAVQRCLAAVRAEPAADVRALELERLDTMYAAAMGVLERPHLMISGGKVVRALNPDDPLDPLGEPLYDDKPILAAIDRLLRIAERRAKLLGLDAAEKVEVSGGVTYEIVGVDPAGLV